MGDNIYLGDRDGVRTPMQWSPDRNGGFSRADPARLYLPPIMDPVYGYQAVNVEAQSRSPSSLLNWMRRLIAVRQARRAFGRGDAALPLSRATARCSPICATHERRGDPLRRQPLALAAGGRARSRRDFKRPRAGRAARPQRLPADRRPALSADLARAWLLSGSCSTERRRRSRLARGAPAPCRSSSRWCCPTAGPSCSIATTARHRERSAAALSCRISAGSPARAERIAQRAWCAVARAAGLRQWLAAHRHGGGFATASEQRYFLPLACHLGRRGERAAQCAATPSRIAQGTPRPQRGRHL